MNRKQKPQQGSTTWTSGQNQGQGPSPDGDRQRQLQQSPMNQGQRPQQGSNTRSSGQNQGHNGQSTERQRQSGAALMECDDNSNYGHQDYGTPTPWSQHGGGQSQALYYSDKNRDGQGGHMQAQTQEQIQAQIQRSLQASKQMLFGVYENVISQLEELESRELGSGKQMPRSQIQLPDQSWKNKKDIQRIVETQLLLFETQMKQCPTKVRDDAREQLIQTTLGWMAHRTDSRIPQSDVDNFAAQLIEILKRGQTKHPDEFYHMPDISQEELKGAVEGIMHGNTKKADLDRAYQENPNKQASLSSIRRGQNPSEGAVRVVTARPDMGLEMEHHTFSHR